MLLFELRLDLAHPGAVLVALEGRRDGGLELLDEAAHISLEGLPPAGWQGQGARALAVVEAVDVAPVVGDRLRAGPPLDGALDHGVLADTGRAEGEDVEALPVQPDAELDGLEGALLSDDAVEGVELRGRLEIERVLCVGVQGARGQGLRLRHGRLPPMLQCAPDYTTAGGRRL